MKEAVVFKYAWSIFKFFLSEKVKSRMFLHGDDIQDLHKYIPKEVLPQEYGGDLISYNDRDMVSKEIDKIYDKFSMMIKTFLS
ncbi:clavesin-2 [Trichonephila inaurata madagascariensis]|uniref:Clavesin-2 n=1 Tax=Trichonephila inaurata madagascariensis TaxID=2747483 RepID=A0A8X6YCA0_9ARAC|nr:clavesin-2 [Trichonephila inaurata madagascariensis]